VFDDVHKLSDWSILVVHKNLHVLIFSVRWTDDTTALIEDIQQGPAANEQCAIWIPFNVEHRETFRVSS
jgi:hypothetical protein